ncbi:MAG: hypothetical protein ABH869_01020 [Candidatus Omnitrophota bacterium]
MMNKIFAGLMVLIFIFSILPDISYAQSDSGVQQIKQEIENHKAAIHRLRNKIAEIKGAPPIREYQGSDEGESYAEEYYDESGDEYAGDENTTTGEGYEGRRMGEHKVPPPGMRKYKGAVSLDLKHKQGMRDKKLMSGERKGSVEVQGKRGGRPGGPKGKGPAGKGKGSGGFKAKRLVGKPGGGGNRPVGGGSSRGGRR